jgi:general secretion pathway protein D
MTVILTRWLRAWLAPCLLTLTVAALAVAQDDPLRDVQRRREVAAQKLEADIKEAFAEASRVEKTNPAKALELLQNMQSRVNDDDVLKATQRDFYRRKISAWIRDLERNVDQVTRQQIEEAARRAQLAARREDDKRKGEEYDKLDRSLTLMRSLRAQGRFDEASKLANELANKYPESPAVMAARRTMSGSDQLAEQRKLKAEREARIALVFRDVEKSSMPPIGDIEFPSAEKWREISKRRSVNKLTEKEAAILRALNAPMNAEFKNQPWQEVMDWLKDRMGIPIIVDKEALETAMINPETSNVNFSLKNVATRTVLKKLLADYNLTFVIKDEMIQVVTKDKAKEMTTARTYYLGDLVAVTDFRFGPAFNQFQMMQNVAALIDTIQNSVEPGSWAPNGPGTITFDARSLSIIVKQTAEVHLMLGGSLR